MSRIVTKHSFLANLAILLASACLSGCMGGPIIQQVASSLLMRAADQATSDAYEAHLLQSPYQQQIARNPQEATASIPGHASASKPSAEQQPQFNQYWSDFLNTGFTPITAVEESLPAADHPQIASNTEQPIDSLAANQLLNIEIWNTVIGEEKLVLLEQARLKGSKLPAKEEWTNWQLALGAAKQNQQNPVIFLIPPDFGRMTSGQEVIVEIAANGELSMARYQLQPATNIRQATN
ncbi:hypothetical protein LG201_05010 [Methylobacillus gramineus]|uniref:hypothetical protein n=1 Tax=Methylobacillus gramineus TaxID=755169 RepID=UPI001CFF9281|nr:hypothetical protein [Methylobacillus gramineus]MCB5184559.1 hypothetical protein [Methylobacillus gramineus]